MFRMSKLETLTREDALYHLNIAVGIELDRRFCRAIEVALRVVIVPWAAYTNKERALPRAAECQRGSRHEAVECEAGRAGAEGRKGREQCLNLISNDVRRPPDLRALAGAVARVLTR